MWFPQFFLKWWHTDFCPCEHDANKKIDTKTPCQPIPTPFWTSGRGKKWTLLTFESLRVLDACICINMECQILTALYSCTSALHAHRSKVKWNKKKQHCTSRIRTGEFFSESLVQVGINKKNELTTRDQWQWMMNSMFRMENSRWHMFPCFDSAHRSFHWSSLSGLTTHDVQQSAYYNLVGVPC